MNDRIMVKVTAMERCLSFRTISRSGKSPHSFLILKAEFSRLKQEAQVISHDISSFAVLRRDPAADTVTIQFHWLDSHSELLRGYRQTVGSDCQNLLGGSRQCPHFVQYLFYKSSEQEGHLLATPMEKSFLQQYSIRKIAKRHLVGLSILFLIFCIYFHHIYQSNGTMSITNAAKRT